jgi:riboflavin synthase
MFTGIVTERGWIRRARRTEGLVELEIECRPIARQLKVGDSVAVSGVCLTTTEAGRRRFRVQVMGETVARTTLGDTERGQPLNLELPARLSDRLGGHLVQGHVDGIAQVARMEEAEGSRRVWWDASPDVLHYIVPRGSVALDGVSLTVVDADGTTFEVALIPHTLAATTLGSMRVGGRANVEVDVIAKYVERLSSAGDGQGAAS